MTMGRRVLLALTALAAGAQLRAEGWEQDTSFKPELINDRPAAQEVRFFPAADGRILAHGPFTHLDEGRFPADGLAFLTKDGIPDTHYEATFKHSISAAVPLTSGGALVAVESGGGWEMEPLTTLFRLHANGRVDESFTGLSHWGGMSLFPLPHGKIAVTCWPYVQISRGVASRLLRLNDDGTVDADFEAKLPSEFPSVHAVAGQTSGHLIVSFEGYDSSRHPAIFHGLVRLLPSGSLDATFPLVEMETPLLDIAVSPEGKIVGKANNQLKRLNPDGSIDSTFVPPAGYPGWHTPVVVNGDESIVTQLDHDVVVLSRDGVVQSRLSDRFPAGEVLRFEGVMPDGSTVVSHSHRNAAGIADDASWKLARLSPAGGTTWSRSLGVRQRTSGTIQSIATDPASRLIVLGEFNEVNGEKVSHAVRFMPDGKLDPSFSLADIPWHGDILTVGPDGSFVLPIYNAADPGPATLVVRRILSDGSIDRTFSAPKGIEGWHALTAEGRVLASRFHPDATREQNFQLVWLQPDGQIEQVYTTRFGGLPSDRISGNSDPSAYRQPLVFATPLADGQLLVGGQFSRVNGVSRPYVARINPDGSLDAAFQPELPLFAHASVERPDSRNRVVISGTLPNQFSSVSVRVQANGEIDRGFYSVPFWPVGAIARQENGLPDLHFPPPGIQAAGIIDGRDGTRWTQYPLARFVPVDKATLFVKPEQQLVQVEEGITLYTATGMRGSAAYQWLLNGAPIAGATNAVLSIPKTAPSDGGQYQCRIVVNGHTIVSAPALLSVAGGKGRLVNFSSLAALSPDCSSTIGFVVANDGARRQWLIRAMGPALRRLGLANAVSESTLTLFSGSNVVGVDRRGAGNAEILLAGARVGAFPPHISPYGDMFPELFSSDSALLTTLQPGAYTARATTQKQEDGVVLLEVYDTQPGGASGGLKNVSVRVPLKTSADFATMGVVIVGPTPVRVLLRGLGPTLSQFGVTPALTDPRLTLHDATGREVSSNSGWADDGAIAAAGRRAGAFPLPSESRDAALIVELNEGTYSVQLKSLTQLTGEALIELYVLE